MSQPQTETARRERDCRKSARYRQKNREKVRAAAREYHRRNAEHLRQYSKRYRAEHPEVKRNYESANRDRINALKRAGYARRPELFRERRRRWAKANREKVTRAAKVYRTRNRSYRIKSLLNNRLLGALAAKKLRKTESVIRLLGCDVVFFIRYIQDRFAPGMTWENHGNGEGKWNIDHRIPCAGFDLTNPKQRKIAFHYSNLQPLWACDNNAKHCSMPGPHQAELL